MIHSICIIDDGIPTEQEELVEIDIEKQLDANTLKYLLRGEIKWLSEEESLKSLIEKLIVDKKHWAVSAFKHPDFFINSIRNELVRPEIIVYDWEFHSESLDRPKAKEEELYNVLGGSFAVVFIYSGADKEEEINGIIESERFKPFVNRIKFIDKGSIVPGRMPAEVLIDEVSNLRDTFSFEFGTKIKQRSLEAVDRILVDLGKATLNDVSKYFKLTDDTKRDLVDFLGERFKNRLHDMDLEELPSETEVPATTYDENLAKRLWAYRLYFHPSESDNIVRRGDIIYKVVEGTNTLYLVISADCDLDRFWHKCFGKINLIPLIKIDSVLREKLLKTVKNETLKDQFTQTSLTSRIKSLVEGPFVLPLIKINGDFLNYLVCPKEIQSINILPPEGLGENRNKLITERLKYDYWSEYKRLFTISEPFLSPMIEHITKSLSGYGVPDYPESVAKTIHSISKEALG